MVSIIEAGAALLAAKEVIPKLLGPSAEYIGESAKNLLVRCDVNLTSIFSKAAIKAGDKLHQDGGVNPRIIKHIINEAAYCEEDLTQEYYAGLLASSKSEDSKDDRALTYIYLLNELSRYQIILHYLSYRLFRDLFLESDYKLALKHHRPDMRFIFPVKQLIDAADIEESKIDSIISHCISGLCRHNIFEDVELLKPKNGTRSSQELVLTPTVFGAELLLWAEGHSDLLGQDLLNKDILISKPLISVQGDGCKFSDRKYV